MQIFYITLLKIKRNVTCLVSGWLEAVCVAVLETNQFDLAIRVLQLLGSCVACEGHLRVILAPKAFAAEELGPCPCSLLQGHASLGWMAVMSQKGQESHGLNHQ